MTNQELEHLEGLCKAATPGPWYYRPNEYDDWGMVRAKPEPDRACGYLTALARAGGHVDEDHHRNEGTDPYEANAAFIAAARTALPALLAEVRKLRAATPTEWMAVAELPHGSDYEWHHLLFPDGTVGNGAYVEVSDEEELGYMDGDYAWCGWDDDVYRALKVQPTHFHPIPSPPTTPTI